MTKTQSRYQSLNRETIKEVALERGTSELETITALQAAAAKGGLTKTLNALCRIKREVLQLA